MKRFSCHVLVCALLVMGVAAGTASASSGPMFTPALGSPFVAGMAPQSVTFSPGGKLLATANANGTLSVLSVTTSGALAEVSGSPFVTGFHPESVAFSPDGGLLASANAGSGTVSVFSVGAGGALTEVSGSPFATGAGPWSVAFSPDGSLLATANSADGAVSVFSVGAGGALTKVSGSPFATGHRPRSLAFSPDGKLLATSNYDDNTISVFSVGTAGTLTEVSGSPFATGTGPWAVAFSPNGKLLATANFSDNTVSVFSVAAGGALTQVTGSAFKTGKGPTSVAFSPDGTLLATANDFANTLSVFAVGTGGALTHASGSPYATDQGPDSVAFSPSGLLATANSGSSEGTVSMFLHDTTPPAITVPGDITAEATGASGAVVSYGVHATDPDSPVASVGCDHPSGSTFPLGSTIVKCTASDPSGNSASASFTVTVQDTTAPVITVPATVTVQATSSSGAFVTYVASAHDLVDGNVTPTCTPPSGSLFGLGSTKVTCTASDKAGNQSSKQFDVVVGGPVESALGQLQDLVAYVGGLPSSTTKMALAIQSQAAVAAYENHNIGRLCMDLLGVVRTARLERSYGQLASTDVTNVVAAATNVEAVIGCSSGLG